MKSGVLFIWLYTRTGLSPVKPTILLAAIGACPRTEILKLVPQYVPKIPQFL